MSRKIIYSVNLLCSFWGLRSLKWISRRSFFFYYLAIYRLALWIFSVCVPFALLLPSNYYMHKYYYTSKHHMLNCRNYKTSELTYLNWLYVTNHINKRVCQLYFIVVHAITNTMHKYVNHICQMCNIESWNIFSSSCIKKG